MQLNHRTSSGEELRRWKRNRLPGFWALTTREQKIVVGISQIVPYSPIQIFELWIRLPRVVQLYKLIQVATACNVSPDELIAAFIVHNP